MFLFHCKACFGKEKELYKNIFVERFGNYETIKTDGA